ncbi:MAG: pseudouridine synthase [Myxococcales bacterium]|nr:pseudouridine synthase [Myxococcales bacterium]
MGQSLASFFARPPATPCYVPAVRLNKFLSETGRWSRREADKVIEAGRVTINGKRVELGTQVAEGDVVAVDGQAVGPSRKAVAPVYLMVNKPLGITCTTERHVHGNIIDFINHRERIFPIGRLDKDSEGIILLTNDGDIVNQVLRVENGHEKEYVVEVNNPISDRFLERLARGVPVLDTITKPCVATRIDKHTFRLILTQGLNRQIRRMCEFLGYEVVRLERVRFMHLTLGSLRRGAWRDLTAAEVAGLKVTPPE